MRWRNTLVKSYFSEVLVCVLLCGLVYQSSAAQESPPLQNSAPLDLQGAMDIQLAEKESRKYWIQMAAGEYAAFTIDCHGKSANVWLLDPTNDRIDGTRMNAITPTRTLELAAADPGRYGLELRNRQANETSITCRVALKQTSSASAKDLDLQQARTFCFKGAVLADAGKYEEATRAVQKALELREKALGHDDPWLAAPLYILGNILNQQANYPRAKEYYLHAFRIEEEHKDDPVIDVDDRFITANNLGALYRITGELDKAAEFLKRAVEVWESSGGKEDPLLAYPLYNLADVYFDRAEYEQSLNTFERVARLEEKAYGPDSTDLADALNGEGNVSIVRGDYLKAENQYSRALAIYEKAGNSGAANPLIGLGNLYSLQAEPEEAEVFYQRALKIFEKSVGTEHPQFAMALHNLAECYLTEREFAKAEDFYHRALATRQKILGENHPEVADTLDGLGTLNREKGDYAAALEFYRRALEINEKALGPEHPAVVSVLTHISMLDMARGNFGEAEAFLSRAIEMSERNTALNVQTGSERQKLAYLDLLSSQLNEAITLNANLADSASSRDLAMTAILRRKGRVLDLLADSLKSVRQNMNAEDAEVLNQFTGVTSRLARLVLDGRQETPMQDYQKKIEVLQEEREQLEREISERSMRFRADSEDVTISAVQAAVPTNAALLEFISYQQFLPRGNIARDQVGEQRYAVYVLRSGEKRWAELGDAKEIDFVVEKLREALRDPSRSDLAQTSRALDIKVMEPIRALIGDARHLLISPDGQLSLIPFEALLDRNNRFELESYSITYLTAGRDLLRMQIPREPKNGPLLIADPLFDGSELASGGAPNSRKGARGVAQRRSITTGDDLATVYFAPLSGTAAEASRIQSFFPDAKLLMGAQATKSALEHVEAPSLLHIATHGFFLTDTDKQKTGLGPNRTPAIHANANAKNPLLRSGLALYGANLTKGASDDGILTALEASGLNLWGTRLVTLSACDTGVGEVRNGEGVYGLRRAFFLAGTESLVMSLWPVSDYMTRELMTQYYAGLKKSLGRGEALRQAQLAMLKRKGHQHPFYWASFIQSGEWANLEGKR